MSESTGKNSRIQFSIPTSSDFKRLQTASKDWTKRRFGVTNNQRKRLFNKQLRCKWRCYSKLSRRGGMADTGDLKSIRVCSQATAIM